MQRNAPKKEKRGFEDPKIASLSAQEQIDSIGVTFVPDVLDLTGHQDKLSALDLAIVNVVAKLTNGPGLPTNNFALSVAGTTLQIVTRAGFTQCSSYFFKDKEPGVAAKVLGVDASSKVPFSLDNFERLPICQGEQEYRWNGPGRPKTTYVNCPTFPELDEAFYSDLAAIFDYGLELASTIRSKKSDGFTIAHYLPEADIATAQRVAHHSDLIEGTDQVARAVALMGEVVGRVGIDPENLATVYRQPGDEIAMNYLESGFVVRGAIHDMTNVGQTNAMNIVFDEYGYAGLQYFESIGVFSRSTNQSLIH